jgi:hypothetical protein
VPSQDSNARLVELIRTGLARADDDGPARLPLKLYSAEEQDELLTLLHAYLWDTATPHDGEWHRSPGNIMTLWAELLEIGTETRHRLIPLRTDLVKLLTERGLGYRTHPRSVPVLVRAYSGPVETPVHAGDPRKTSSTIAFGAWGAGLAIRPPIAGLSRPPRRRFITTTRRQDGPSPASHASSAAGTSLRRATTRSVISRSKVYPAPCPRFS